MSEKRKLTSEEIIAAERLKAIYLQKKKELRLTQDKVAASLGVTQGSIYQWMNAKTPIGIKALLGLARVLQVTPSEIFPQLADEYAHGEVRESAKSYSLSEKKQPSLTDREIELITLLRSLSQKERVVIEILIKKGINNDLEGKLISLIAGQ